jgi:ribose 5-phosphate isomerase B
MIFLGADHAGYDLKELVKEYLGQIKFPYEDLGAAQMMPGDDYVDYAEDVAVRVAKGFGMGLLICDTGIGMCMAANKVEGVRAAACTNILMAKRAREHNDANVLCVGVQVNTSLEVMDIMRAFLEAEFSQEERHIRRVKKLGLIERILKLEE